MIERFAPMNHCFQRYQLDTFLSSISKIGYKKIDIWTCPNHFLLDSYSHSDANVFKNKLRMYDLEVSCLSPRQSCPQPYNLATKDPEMITYVKHYFQNAVYSAHELEIPRIMITSGWSFSDENEEEGWLRSVDMCKWLSSFAEAYGVNVAMEPLTRESTRLVNSFEKIKKYVEDVNESNLKIILETGTIIRSNDTITDYFAHFENKIDYCHLTSYKVGNFSHVSWQDGHLDLNDILREMKRYNYTGDFCLEYTDASYQKNPEKIYADSYKLIRELEE